MVTLTIIVHLFKIYLYMLHLELALVFLEEERVMQHSSVSISLIF